MEPQSVQSSDLPATDADVETLLHGLDWRPDEATAKDDVACSHDAELLTSGGLRLRLVAPLAQGGMGEVHVATIVGQDKVVAVKMPHTAFLEAGLGEVVFLREQRFPCGLRHPNIVSTLDHGEANGRPFVVMEYVAGDSLEAVVQKRIHGKQRTLPWRDVCAFVRQAGDGLAFAHEHGIIHRDVKPANLVLGDDGIVRVLDWGFVRVSKHEREASARLTDSGDFLGSYDYISEEQAADPRSADARSDLYSLGCTFYFLLTGQPPFWDRKTEAGKLQAHAAAPRPRVRKYCPDVPRRIEAIVLKLMEIKPDHRYATAQELLAALDWATAGGVAGPLRRFAWNSCHLLTKAVWDFIKFVCGMTLVVVGLWTLAFLWDWAAQDSTEILTAPSGLQVSVPKRLLEEDRTLVELILQTDLLRDDERQRWMKRLTSMDAAKRKRLQGFLSVDGLPRIEGRGLEGGAEDVVVPDDIRVIDPALVDLIIRSQSMTEKERKFWLMLLIDMDDEKRQQLKAILQRERDELNLIDRRTDRILAELDHASIAELIKGLGSEHSEVRARAAIILARWGPQAKEAVPSLVKCLRDTDPKVRQAAGEALRKIDPEAAKNVDPAPGPKQ